MEGDALMLPNLPRRLYKEQKQIAAFGGLNRTEGADEGEFIDAYGLSAYDYPSMRPSKDDICVQNGATDIFEWGGNIVTIRNGILYYNGDALCNATPHTQFAVAGNKLMMIPDEICIDLTNGTSKKYRASAKSTTHAGDVTFGAEKNTAVYAELQPRVQKGIHCQVYSSVSYENGHYSENPTVYTYGKDQAAVRAAYQDGQWNLDALEELRACFAEGDRRALEAGDIFIPQEVTAELSPTFSVVTGVDGALPDKSLQSSAGYFAVVTRSGHEKGYGFDGNKAIYVGGFLEFDVYSVSNVNQPFSELFDVGDWITISGTTGGVYDMTAKVTSFETGKNVMNLDCNALIPYTHWLNNKSTEENYVYFKYRDARGSIQKRMSRGIEPFADAMLLYVESTQKLYVRQKSGGETAYDTEATTLTTDEYFFLNNYYPNQEEITFAAKAPKLDYICANQNRIYGVSNADKTLYISALGKPMDFFTYSGDADSYAVAIGSNGDFTAICAYGGGVLVFKENSLIKVFGNSPSDFYTNEYVLSGVQKGSGRSLCVVDETLYYKGVYGIYAYSGGMPTLLSAKLGNEIMTDAVAGSDGTHYYVCMADGTKTHTLYVYDIRRGLWMKDRAVQADSFAAVDGKLLMAANGCQYTLYAGERITHEWLAEFAPFGEAVHAKKTYTTLRLRLDMQPGSQITVDVRENHAPWRTAYTQGASSALSLNIPLCIGRCDRLRVRLRGSGDVTVRSMVREMLRGNEV